MASVDPFKRFEGLEPRPSRLVLGRFHRDRLSLRGFSLEARLHAKALLRGKGARQKFLVIGRARSGTTLLENLLNQVPGVECGGELWHYAVANPGRLLDAFARKSDADAAGARILAYQVIHVQKIADPIRFFEKLHKEGVSMIHLTRDSFAQTLSIDIAQATRRYHDRMDGAGPAGAAARSKGAHRLDPTSFIRKLQWSEATLEFERDCLSTVPHLSLTYEEGLLDPARHQATVDRVCDWLNVATGPVSAGLRKVLSRSFAENVVNSEEILTAMDAAGLSHLKPAEA